MNLRSWGWVLIAVAVAMTVFFAAWHPRALVVGLAPAVLMCVAGGLMLTGRWPVPPR
ncbi:transketolase C-terminal domain/subunit [Deinococcus metalli]|uniref:Transketolase C-terminal domain/subunit n=1 Tax=Deinococcus metalli TaxID=1141878 RepID=A0A7W8KE93_9DEIO|nr:hypothetical protein [Deinococcus metalli]MBB5376584.1 transketolase C-terminal domain/subunit [Deinococcus metalli]GHF42978.1 hypothetical protein GCM10017781_19180 [Deinococcus metalli]